METLGVAAYEDQTGDSEVLREFDRRGSHGASRGGDHEGGPFRKVGALERAHGVGQVVDLGRDVEADGVRQGIGQPVRDTDVFRESAVVVLLVQGHRGIAEGGVAEHGLLGAHHVPVGTAVLALTAVQQGVHPHPVADRVAGDVAADGGDDACGLVAECGGQVLERSHPQQAHDPRGQTGGGDLHDHVERTWLGDGQLVQDECFGALVRSQSKHRGHQRTSTVRLGSRSGV